MKKGKILLFLALISLSIGILCLLAGSILSFFDVEKISDVLLVISSVLGVVALLFLITRGALIINDGPMEREDGPKVVVKVVDVKDLPKTREQELYEQYENLYKQNLITKEDLDAKRVELIGK